MSLFNFNLTSSMKKYLLTLLSILLFFCSQNSFAQSKKEGQDTTKNQGKSVPIKEYYESGKLKVEGFVKNNCYDSTFISYYENGQIEAKGSFKDCVFETNALRITALDVTYCGGTEGKSKGIRVSDSNKNGIWKSYYENGQLEVNDNYICGIRIGLQFEYYSSGKLKMQAFSSTEDALTTYFFENGNIESIIKYNREYELKEGKDSVFIEIKVLETMEYYETGELESIIKERNRKKDGKQIYFYKNGFIEYKEEYKNGVENGLFLDYYENGNAEWQAEMKDGEYDGKQYHCNQEGKITKIQTWKKGKLIKTEIPNQE